MKSLKEVNELIKTQRKLIAEHKDKLNTAYQIVNSSSNYIRLAEEKISEYKKVKLELQKDLSVSDHAVLRYLEREKGIDVESLKQEIKNHPALKKYKNDGLYIGKKLKFSIRNGIVITIMINEDGV